MSSKTVSTASHPPPPLDQRAVRINGPGVPFSWFSWLSSLCKLCHNARRKSLVLLVGRTPLFFPRPLEKERVSGATPLRIEKVVAFPRALTSKLSLSITSKGRITNDFTNLVLLLLCKNEVGPRSQGGCPLGSPGSCRPSVLLQTHARPSPSY